jgi:hypothetical protein
MTRCLKVNADERLLRLLTKSVITAKLRPNAKQIDEEANQQSTIFNHQSTNALKQSAAGMQLAIDSL